MNRIRFAPVVPDKLPLIAAACDDRRIWIWRASGQELGELPTSSAINDISFSPGGDAITAGSDGSTVRVWRWKGLLHPKGLSSLAFERHSDSITEVAFSHGGERIVSASADRTVRVFDSRSMAQIYFTSPPLPGIVTSVAFHRGDNLVVSGCDDGGVRLHTIDQPTLQVLGTFGAPARSPEFSADGKYIVAASGDKTARLWEIADPKREIAPVQHPAPVTQATFRPVIDGDNYPFITTATNGEVRLIKFSGILKSGNSPASIPDRVLEPRHSGSAVSAIWSADGRWLATVGGGEVLLWEWAGDLPIARLRITNLHPGTSRAEFSPDASQLVTYGGDPIACVWDLAKLPSR